MDNLVGDEEILYRLVKPKRGYVKLENGEWRPSSQAFTDRFPRCRISVDRADLCDEGPAHTQVYDTDLICSVVVGPVRKINTVEQRKPGGQIIQKHEVCVDHTPLPDNHAHADIYVIPYMRTKGVFRKLQERLALLATWEEGFGPEEAFVPSDA